VGECFFWYQGNRPTPILYKKCPQLIILITVDYRVRVDHTMYDLTRLMYELPTILGTSTTLDTT